MLPGKAEIRDFELIVLEQKEIFALEIPMDDVAPMQVFQAASQILEQLLALGIRASTFVLDVVEQIAVLGQVHHDVHFGRELENVRGSENVAVVDPLEDVYLAREELLDEILKIN